MADGSFSKATREAVIARANGKCELCGQRLEVGHFHHRRPRGMGGTNRSDSAMAANCLLVHPRCHSDIESSRQRALDKGWLVMQTHSPSETPVSLWSGVFLLADDGSISPAWGSGGGRDSTIRGHGLGPLPPNPN
jgi:5-methylcytosine-specific restriction enzyme A